MTSSTEREQRLTSAHTELGRSLVEYGILTEEFSAAFDAVPRTSFLPDVIWPHDQDAGKTVAV